MKGQVCVGSIVYPGAKWPPKKDGYEYIIVMMKGHGGYWQLSPYILKDGNGRIMENIWQAAKVYPEVKASKQYDPRSKYSNTKKVIFQHPAERHLDVNGRITQEYRDWRKKLSNNPYPVRYPVGFNERHTCVYALKEDDNGNIIEDQKLDYVQSRKEIYGPLYCKMAKQQPKFKELQDKLKAGINLMIVEVDGPKEELMDYYKKEYNVDDNFIVNNTIDVTEKNMRIMLNDTKKPFGHGYCLAIALLDKEEWFRS